MDHDVPSQDSHPNKSFLNPFSQLELGNYRYILSLQNSVFFIFSNLSVPHSSTNLSFHSIWPCSLSLSLVLSRVHFLPPPVDSFKFSSSLKNKFQFNLLFSHSPQESLLFLTLQSCFTLYYEVLSLYHISPLQLDCKQIPLKLWHIYTLEYYSAIKMKAFD